MFVFTKFGDCLLFILLVYLFVCFDCRVLMFAEEEHGGVPEQHAHLLLIAHG